MHGREVAPGEEWEYVGGYGWQWRGEERRGARVQHKQQAENSEMKMMLQTGLRSL